LNLQINDEILDLHVGDKGKHQKLKVNLTTTNVV